MVGLISFFVYRFREIIDLIFKLYPCYKKHFSPRLVFCCDININKVPCSTIFPHPYGITIKDNVNLGENVLIRQNVTIGMRYDSRENGTSIGNDVDIGANVLILGPITIGKGAKIGAGSIILKDVPPNFTIIGIWK